MIILQIFHRTVSNKKKKKKQMHLFPSIIIYIFIDVIRI